MVLASVVSRSKRHDLVVQSASERYSWIQIASFVLGISLLVNVVTVSILYKHDALGKSAGNEMDFSDEIFEFTSIMNRHDFHDSDNSFDWRRLSSSSSSSSSSGSTSSSSSSSSTSSTSASTGAHGSSGGHAHQHDSLVFLFNAIVIGAAIMQLNMWYPALQQTVLLFLAGFLSSLFIRVFKLDEKLGVFGDSYTMWTGIDPHLLLFTLLPALLAGDAMTIDTSVAKKVYLQCLWLAGPGVLVGGFGAAFFLWVYLGWDFWLCLCAGAILCATDPVAVVALLKELGASPMLTVQIQGESLLNDGTAIVLYLISYAIVRGEKFEWTDVAEFLIKKAMMAWALGLFIGYFFFSWIRLASNRLEHSSGMIQITLTLICAYWSFMFVEGVLTLSGVLATVAASLVLANHMWPYIVSETSMHHVWHTFESLGNIIIFFLAGSITGKMLPDIDAIDYVHLLVIYLVLLVIRGTLIFGCRPILSYLSMVNQPVSWQEAAVMTWGGLRGAVGLALAITVNLDRAPDICNESIQHIDPKTAERLLFYVSGVAFLTMVVNATTAPYIVNALGITATPQARKQLLKMFHEQLVRWSIKGDNPPEVTESLQHMLDEALGEIDHQKVDAKGPKSERTSTLQRSGTAALGPVERVQNNKDIIAELDAEKKRTWDLLKVMFQHHDAHDNYDRALTEILGEDQLVQEIEAGGAAHIGTRLPNVSKDNPFGDVEEIKKLLQEDDTIDIGMAKIINKAFMDLIYKNYWSQIEQGTLRPGSPESEILLTSVRISLSPFRPDLCDYEYVENRLQINAKVDPEEDPFVDLGDDSGAHKDAARDSGLAKLVTSWQFSLTVMIVILLNSLQVVAEEIWRDNCTATCPGEHCPKKGIDDHAMWLVLDAIFTVFFTVEFILKFSWLKCDYYRDNWNKFDFFLVLIGIFGVIASMVTHGKEADIAGKTRIIRVARVLRTLRFLRIIRLFNARMSADKYVSIALAKRMKIIVTLNCFITAQLKAQAQLVEYFGGDGEVNSRDESELGRCILQSQINTYKALYQAALTKQQLGEDRTQELALWRTRKQITEGLRTFVEKAHHAGALSSTEAHAILHPLDHEVAHCMKILNERAEGVISTGHHGHGDHGHGHRDSDMKSAMEKEEHLKPITAKPAENEVIPGTVGAAMMP